MANKTDEPNNLLSFALILLFVLSAVGAFASSWMDVTDNYEQNSKLSEKVSAYTHKHPDYTITKISNSKSVSIPGSHVKHVVYSDKNSLKVHAGNNQMLGKALNDADEIYIFSDNKKDR